MLWFSKLRASVRSVKTPADSKTSMPSKLENAKLKKEASRSKEPPSSNATPNVAVPQPTNHNSNQTWTDDFQIPEAQINQLWQKEEASISSTPERQATEFNDPTTPPPTCIITAIPLDVLYCITDLLPQVNLLILSYTCRGFYQSLHPITQKLKGTITDTEHRHHLALLCKSNIDQYVCLVCKTIHSMESLNHPYEQRRFCRSQNPIDVFHGSSLHGPFQLNHGHVQLACKLSQAPTTLTIEQKKFLNSVLAQFATTSATLSPTNETRNTTTFWAQARVRNNTLILKRRWQATHAGVNHEYNIGKIFGDLQVCPHFNTLTHNGEAVYAGQIRWFALGLRPVLQEVGSVMTVKCGACTTDITVRSQATGTISITAWQTLGGPDSETFGCWEEHLWKDSIRLPLKLGQWDRQFRERTLLSQKLFENR